MPNFSSKEAKDYYARTNNEKMAHRLDTALYNAESYLYWTKHAHSREHYEEGRTGYFQQLAILREYGIFAV